MIEHVKIISIPVRDQDKALHFYTKMLGLKVVTDQPHGDGMRWIELKMPGSDTNLALFTAPGSESMIGKFSNIAFSCKDVEKTYGELKERGVTFSQPPKKESWGGTTAIFQDQDGTSFCISGR